MGITRPTINFRTKQIVVSDAEAKPYVGFHHLTESPDGFLYDIKRWCSLFDLRLPTMPRLADASTQGVSESKYFKSGVGDKDFGDLYLNDIKEMSIDNNTLWIPEIRNGHYFRYKTPFFLYSDNSRIQYLTSSNNRSNRNYIKLDAEPEMTSPILAASFKRNPKTNTPDYDIHVHQCADFTGIYLNEEEQETVTSAGKILWDNVDFTKKEFIVDNTIEGETSLYFNRDYIKTHGVVPTVFQDLAACEILGSSDGSNYQVYKLKYFPVLADDSFHLYVVSDFTWTEWERVDSWFDLINSDPTYLNNRYFVDKDLGIVYLGSNNNGGVPVIGDILVACYSSTLRIEYEEAETKNILDATEADVNPITQHINQGFVVITHNQLEAASIVLDINKPRIPFTSQPPEYGPITIGSDYALLRATVKSTEGNAIPGKLVGFTMIPSGIGYLDGAEESSSITDGIGQAYSSYQPPVSTDTLGFYTVTTRASTHPSYTSGYKDVIIKDSNAGLELQEDNLYIYQVLKDDIILGYDNVDDWITAQIADGNLEVPSWAITSELESKWRDEIRIKYDLKEWNGSDEFNSTGVLTGRKVVVYKIDPTGASEYEGDNWDSNAINPITGELGAVVPLRPEFIEKINDASDEFNNYYRLIYPEAAIPDCDPDDSGNPIGGYWVVSPRTIKFRASCWSEFYNRIIYSNEITVRISMPEYMLGEYLTPLLEKVPYGWRIPSETSSMASGIDGATFITINPFGTYNPSPDYNNVLWGPYEIFDVINGTIDDDNDWADAPFQSIGFQFVKHGASIGFQFNK